MRGWAEGGVFGDGGAGRVWVWTEVVTAELETSGMETGSTETGGPAAREGACEGGVDPRQQAPS